MRQPGLFISHGTMYEAIKSVQLKSDFLQIRQEHIKHVPDAVVIFSGHWQTETISVMTNEKMNPIDEGFPSEFQANYSTVGNPQLAHRIIEILVYKGIKAKADKHRGLDHGALIPLMLPFPNEKIPVLQISQQYLLDPNFHQNVAAMLSPLCEENILFIGSGGLVHNRNEIKKFGGHEIAPSAWAKEFDDFITKELADSSNVHFTDKIINAYNHPLFSTSHPSSEHFLPLVFSSAFGATVTKIYEAFQWKNLSMSAFMFT